MKTSFPLLDFLEDMAARPGATGITLCSDGRAALRQGPKLAVTQLAPLREFWAQTVAELFQSQSCNQARATVLVGGRGSRFRAVLNSGAEGETLSVRFLHERTPTPAELLLPAGLEQRFNRLRSGLFLVCGPAGSGTSTTVASLLLSRAGGSGGKIVSFESPIERRLEGSEACLLLQRDAGRDDASLARAVDEAARGDADLISVQNLPGPATARAVLAAAQGGPLVVASLPAASASVAPHRLLALIDASSSSPFLRDAMAGCLEGVLMQRLLPGFDGLVPVFELLWLREAGERLQVMESLVRAGDSLSLRQEIERGRHGMLSLQECFRQRVDEGLLAASGWEAGGLS